MITVVVVIHLIVAASMIGLILLQKTEGNASGGGFSSSASLSSMMQPRTRANPLSRATVIMGILFFITSMGLALLSKQAGPAPSIFSTPEAASGTAPKVNDLRTDPATPAAGTPAAPAADAPAETPAVNFGGGAAPSAAPPAVPQGAPAVPSN